MKVKYLDLDGKVQEIEANGLLATCLQHEIDHLNGVLFIDHISKLKRDMVMKKFTKAAKKAEGDKTEPRIDPTRTVCERARLRELRQHAAAPDLHGHARFRGADVARARRRGHDIAAVYTRAAKPAGARPGVAAVAGRARGAALGLTVVTPASLKSAEAQAAFRAHKADAAVVVAYGLILPKPILEAPRLGCFNVHASLLPRWRGAAPINRAIMAGDAESGVTVMKMDEGLDTGAMAMAERVADRARHDRGRIA